MCKDAKALLDDLKKGVHFFKIQDYQYQDYEGEIAEVAKYCQQGNAQAILSLLKNKNIQKNFEIKHPLYNDITLRAVYSIANHANNYVFFVDSSNTFCLCIVQNCNFVNFFITEQIIFKVSIVWDGAMQGSIGYLCAQSRAKNILPQHIAYRESEFAYNLHHYRPAHYFGHMLANYIYLQDKPVFQNQCFFLPQNTKIITESDRVLFYPMTYLHQDLTQSSFLIFSQSLQDFNSLVAPQDKLDKFDKEEITQLQIAKLSHAIKESELQ
ncbi:hypothetical protein [Helicobacter rodentium]|uniref:hypothetical protein n=1 Tax=Helicobacter rodentium TaxID=59617 RepID=UPI002355CBB9|nr:hypothetical protein [Helicobacter rodentium]